MKPSFRFSLTLLLTDLAFVMVIFNAVAIARGLTSISAPFIFPLFVPAGLLIAALALIDAYNPRTDFLSLDYTSQHLIAVTSASVCTLLFTFVLLTGGFALQQSRLLTGLSFVLVAPVGLVSRRLLALRRAAVRGHREVVFVGDQTSADAFRDECQRLQFSHPIIYAGEDQSLNAKFISLENIVTEIENQTRSVETIILRESAQDLPAGLPNRLMRLHFAGVPTYTLELFHEQVWRKIPLYRINPIWLFQGGFQLAREPMFERLKRVSDLGLAFVVLLLSAPLLALAALAIRLDDGGPIFFRQTRIGCNRQPFTLYKLRSMRVVEGGARYTASGDKRITRVGKVLRASRLDELPQLLNVLKGDMSMIGPRAEWDALVKDYETQIPCYHFRHLVRPGITGWAQVNYPYGANLTDTLRKLEYDLYYIRHYSFRLDAAIVLKTIHVMLFGKGSR